MVPRRYVRSLTHSATLIVAIALLSACSRALPPRGRVLLVGIDGATLRIARPMLESGRLPNLAALGRDGVYGRIQSQMPLSSPRIWNSIATGVGPHKHGILTFAYEGRDGRQRLYGSTDRKALALWNIASDAGLSVAVINWWTTFPVDRVDGVIISDHVLEREIEGRRDLTGAALEAGPVTHPSRWEERVARLLAEGGRASGATDPFADRDALPAWAKPAELSRRFENDDAVTRIALAVESEIRPDLMMVFLPGIDRVSHWLWGAVEPDPDDGGSRFDARQRVAAAAALRATYAYTDALIGALLARYGADDLVMVVSDHGFEAGGAGALTGTHETVNALYGVVFARGPGIGAPTEPRGFSVNDVTPTILAWLGLPVAEDMDGRPGAFLHVPEVARIASYGGPVERAGDAPSGAEGAILERLGALGYLEHARDE